jgi:hypothetical protein
MPAGWSTFCAPRRTSGPPAATRLGSDVPSRRVPAACGSSTTTWCPTRPAWPGCSDPTPTSSCPASGAPPVRKPGSPGSADCIGRGRWPRPGPRGRLLLRVRGLRVPAPAPRRGRQDRARTGVPGHTRAPAAAIPGRAEELAPLRRGPQHVALPARGQVHAAPGPIACVLDAGEDRGSHHRVRALQATLAGPAGPRRARLPVRADGPHGRPRSVGSGGGAGAGQGAQRRRWLSALRSPSSSGALVHFRVVKAWRARCSVGYAG